MSSSNKVVIIKRGAFGVTHEAMGEVFNNRKALTSWLPANIDIVHPGTGVFLREAVDVSYSEGKPLRYNSNVVVAKWLAGTTSDDGMLVRMVLKQDDLDGVGWDMFAPTDKITNDSLVDTFKVRPEVLERVRVVASIEPFCAASKAGLQIGDILLRQRNLRTTELFLVPEAQPYIVGLGPGNISSDSDGTGFLFVARFVPNFGGATNTKTTSLALTGVQRVASIDSDEDENLNDDSTLEAKAAEIQRIPLRGLRSRVNEANGFLSPRKRSNWIHGRSVATPPPNHIFATDAKRAQFQLPFKTLSVQKTRAYMAKQKSPAKHRTQRSFGSTDSVSEDIGFDFLSLAGESTSKARLPGNAGQDNKTSFCSSNSLTDGSGNSDQDCDEVSLVDKENVATGSTEFSSTRSKERIAQLEAEVASLRKALAKIDVLASVA